MIYNQHLSSPKVTSVEDLGILVRWMTSEPQLEEGKKRWLKAEKVSADEISAGANLKRLYEQRNAFRKENWKGLAANYEKAYSINSTYWMPQTNLYVSTWILPDVLQEDAAPMLRIHNRMLRARIMKLREDKDCQKKNR